jgi:hypothetical protein
MLQRCFGEEIMTLTIKDLLEDRHVKDPNSGCWLWFGADSGRDGYGGIRRGGKEIKAHRASYTIFNGEIPEGMYVLHKCDVRCCINPDHLFLGTHIDNMRDRFEKGRYNTKISVAEVEKIRNLYADMEYTQAQLAKIYKVDASLISRIIAGKRRVALSH